MNKQSTQTGKTPKIILNISGNASVKGWDKLEVMSKCSVPDAPIIDDRDEEIRIECRSDSSLSVPYGAFIQVDRIDGDTTIKSVEGDISILQIDGNLSLRSVGSVTIGIVQGNIAARNIDGDLRLEKCQGNVSVRDIRGDFLIDEGISGNLTLKEIDGSAKANARGNVNVSLDPSPESSYDFQAKGNLSCRLPADASAKIRILQGSHIDMKFPGIEVPAHISTPYEVTLGDGDADLTFRAAGKISLLSRPADWDMGGIDIELGDDFELMTEALNEQISSQFEAQMEMMEEELEQQLEMLSFSLEKTALSAEQAERIAERAREVSERANRRAQEKIRRSQEKMQRKLEAARLRAESKASAAERAARDRRRRPEPPIRPIPPSRVSDPVSDEERLLILQMVEQGTVTPEEAEHLLAALAGKSV